MSFKCVILLGKTRMGKSWKSLCGCLREGFFLSFMWDKTEEMEGIRYGTNDCDCKSEGRRR